MGGLTMRSVFGHHRAMLESAARARPYSLEAVHFPPQAAQPVSAPLQLGKWLHHVVGFY
jgi:hypothetical protein